MTPGSPRPAAASRAIFALLILAPVVLGVGAALLVGPLPASRLAVAPTPAHTSVELVGLAVTGILLIVVAAVILPILFGQRRSYGPRVLTTVLAYFVVAIIILIGLHLVAPGSPPSGAGSTQNGTTPPPPPAGNRTNLSLGFPGGILLPGWVFFLILAVVAVALGAVTVPLGIRRREVRLAVPERPRSDERRSALEEAIVEFDESTLVPRERIILVYRRLLQRVGPRAGDLDRMTAREIEAVCRNALGIRASSAHELTALFEEARYSDHEIAETMVVRARAALAAALEDLDRSTERKPR
ncbi:MAG: DUF4129 domain-containing protein [Thermoplasmata archaeon]|nr:DUF4129 domain-containing protein [Thermoplasmata archaeon]